MDQNESALTLFENYAVAKFDPAKLKEVLQTNLGGATINEQDLDTVHVPLGGATIWSVPSVAGDLAVQELAGIIVSWKDTRRYWEKSYGGEGGGQPPDCYSDDDLTGVGKPGGICADCPLSKFGTARDDKGKPGAGQACQAVRVVALLQQGDLIPILIHLPPTSLKSIRSYFLGLTRRAIPVCGVVTSFKLRKEKSKGGLDVAVADVTMIEQLSDAQLEQMQAYARDISSKLRTTTQEVSETMDRTGTDAPPF